MRIGQGDQRGHPRPSRLDVPGKVKLQQTLQDVFDKVRSDHCREIPVQLGQEEKLPFLVMSHISFVVVLLFLFFEACINWF